MLFVYFCVIYFRSRLTSVPEKVIGPVICIGDFCDGYDMPPPKIVNNLKEEDAEDIYDVSHILII